MSEETSPIPTDFCKVLFTIQPPVQRDRRLALTQRHLVRTGPGEGKCSGQGRDMGVSLVLNPMQMDH